MSWLAEAYASPVSLGDIGYVGRNVTAAAFLKNVLRHIARESDMFLDYGAGYGMLVRLMRDSGFRFHWFDPHCQNLFAPCCEAGPDAGRKYRALTAIEVFEHLPDPLATLNDMVRFSTTILFTTQLVPCPQPAPDAWRYFGLDHGQHVSFYTAEALRVLAAKAGLRYRQLQNGWHALCPSTDRLLNWKSSGRIRLAARFRRRLARLFGQAQENPLFQADARKVRALIERYGTEGIPRTANLDDIE